MEISESRMHRRRLGILVCGRYFLCSTPASKAFCSFSLLEKVWSDDGSWVLASWFVHPGSPGIPLPCVLNRLTLSASWCLPVGVVRVCPGVDLTLTRSRACDFSLVAGSMWFRFQFYLPLCLLVRGSVLRSLYLPVPLSYNFFSFYTLFSFFTV